MKYCISLLLAILVHPVNAQNDNDPTKQWNKGTVMLRDGSERRGLLRYENRTGVLAFNDAEDSQSFTANTITAFEYLDEVSGLPHTFYAMPYQDPKHKNKTRPQFFEIIREYQTFTILSKIDPVASSQFSVPVSPGQMNAPITEAAQTETIYIMMGDNIVRPYARTTTKRYGYHALSNDEDTGLKDKDMIDADLLATAVTKPLYHELTQYAKEQHLSFERREHLMKILDYYETLVN